jgi:hypothetical protein
MGKFDWAFTRVNHICVNYKIKDKKKSIN